MTNQQDPPSNCPNCGQPLSAEDTRCPRCSVLLRKDALTPLGGPAPPAPAPTRGPSPQEEGDLYRPTGPVARAPGQDPPGSWGYIVNIVKHDPLFAVVLGLLALRVLVALSSGGLIFALIPAAIFWGVYTFQDWGYWLSLIGAGFGLAYSLLSLGEQPGLALFWSALFGFVIVVLVRRKEYFGVGGP